MYVEREIHSLSAESIATQFILTRRWSARMCGFLLLGGLIILTHPDGSPVAINPEAVASVHPTTKGYNPGTMIDSTGSGSEIVSESFEEVVARLNKAEGCSK
jgi:hypothetical protein